MPSKLYEAALAGLATKTNEWTSLAVRIRSVSGPDIENQNGQDTLQMIEEENQLSDNPKTYDASLFVSLLNDLCENDWPDPSSSADLGYSKNFSDRYEQVTDRYMLKGNEINATPSVVYRYITDATGIFLHMAEALRLRGMVSYSVYLSDLVEKARTARDGYGWEEVVKFVAKDEVWNSLPRDQFHLCRRSRMFVTFGLVPPEIRDNCRRIHAALALWKNHSPNGCFLEVAIQTDRTDKLRFPTFADTGWYRYFCSASPDADHGFTRPHPSVDNFEQQPEAVMQTQSFQRPYTQTSMRVVPP